MVDKEFAMAFEGPPLRSSLPCPNVIRDGFSEPLQHMSNGRYYESKRAMARADKEAGCECIGNEKQVPTAPGRSPVTKDEVGRALQKLKMGYKPATKTGELSADIESGFF